MKKVLVLLLCAVMLLSCMSACGNNSGGGTTPASGTAENKTGGDNSATTIIVGSKDFAENLIVGQLYIQLLKEHGYTVVDKTNVSGSDVCQKALANGDFDVYPEYTGTIWYMVCGHDSVPEGGPEALYANLEAELATAGVYRMGERTEVNNTYCFALKPEMADELGIKTLSELGAYMQAHPGELSFAGDQEFCIRSDGLLGMADHYGIDFGANIFNMEKGLCFQAIDNGQVDVAMSEATDGRLLKYGLLLLEDDLFYFPTYNLIPFFRTEWADEHPEAVELLNQLAPYMTDSQLQALNSRVDADGEEPEDVAADFLRENGFIS